MKLKNRLAVLAVALVAVYIAFVGRRKLMFHLPPERIAMVDTTLFWIVLALIFLAIWL